MTLISGIGATEPLASIALDLKAAAGIPALSAAGYSLLKGILSFFGRFIMERSQHTIIATCTVFGVERRSRWADRVGLDLYSILYLALRVCVRERENNVIRTAPRIKYPSVYACHEMRGDLTGSGCIYCVHALCGCAQECLHPSSSVQRVFLPFTRMKYGS